MSDYLDLAIKLSENSEGGPFGAVVVKDDYIIGCGSNNVVNSYDPTAHAEVNAIRSACKYIKNHNLNGCVLYSSCEPCPMCLSASYWSGIEKIIYANDRHLAEEIGFNDKFIYEEFRLPHKDKKVKLTHLPSKEAEIIMKKWSGRLY